MERYPLNWPEGWKRTVSHMRARAQFGKSSSRYDAQQNRTIYGGKQRVTVNESITRILDSLGRMGVRRDDAIISTNVPTRLDGLPYSNTREPSDPGVAVYWKEGKNERCMAIDRYDRVADNLAAIAATLEAFRTVERHGGAEILNRAFAGFLSLPERAGGKSWRDVLEYGNSPAEPGAIKKHFTILAKTAHPDGGGTDEEFHELIWARDAALREAGQ